MIKSMTAYASAEITENQMTVSMEIRSVNSRHLDLIVRLGQGYAPLEEKIKKAASRFLARGRVELMVKIRDEREDAAAFEIDEIRAGAYHAALVQLKRRFDLAGDISIDLMAAAGGVVKPVEMERDLAECWPVVETCLGRALEGLDAMRTREGDYLARDFGQRLDFIGGQLEQIDGLRQNLLAVYQKRLKERIAALTGGGHVLDDGRIEQEAALMADRSDISEELVRARSHVEQFKAIMAGPEPGGRKLNFLLQEFNREFNTMGSKAGNTDISHMIVAVKAELEKLREQVQNIE